MPTAGVFRGPGRTSSPSIARAARAGRADSISSPCRSASWPSSPRVTCGAGGSPLAAIPRLKQGRQVGRRTSSCWADRRGPRPPRRTQSAATRRNLSVAKPHPRLRRRAVTRCVPSRRDRRHPQAVVPIQRCARRRLQAERHRRGTTAEHSDGLAGNGLAAVANPDRDPRSGSQCSAAQPDLEPPLLETNTDLGLGRTLGAVVSGGGGAAIESSSPRPRPRCRPGRSRAPGRCASRPRGPCTRAGSCTSGTARCRGCTRTGRRLRWRTSRGRWCRSRLRPRSSRPPWRR